MNTARSISMQNGELIVSDNPIIPFIEGDGIGSDIWSASVRVFDSAIGKAYGGNKKIEWLEAVSYTHLTLPTILLV